MGDIAKLIIKIGLVAVLVLGMATLINTILAYDTSGFSSLWSVFVSNPLWWFLLRGIAVGKWLFGAVPLTIIIDATLVYVAFLISGAVASFVKVTFFDKS